MSLYEFRLFSTNETVNTEVYSDDYFDIYVENLEEIYSVSMTLFFVNLLVFFAYSFNRIYFKRYFYTRNTNPEN